MAAGFSLNEDKIEEFRKFVGEYVRDKIGNEAIVPVINADGVLDVSGATPELAKSLAMLEPFGAQNPEPRLVLPRVHISKVSIVGSGHIRCFLTSASGGSLKAMAFRMADTEAGMALLNHRGAVYNVIGTLRQDNWMGRNGVQFIIEDVSGVLTET